MFIKGPRLPIGRQGHTAGKLRDAITKEEMIVVAGGFNNGRILKSTAMLRYGEWEQGTQHAEQYLNEIEKTVNRTFAV